MNTSEDLNELYEEWRALSRSENQAIRAFDWKSLASYQKQKEELQQRIQRLESLLPRLATIPVQGPAPSGLRTGEAGSEFGRLLSELIQMERENHQLLENQKNQLRRQQAELKQSGQNLRRLHKAYVSDPHAVWQTYS